MAESEEVTKFGEHEILWEKDSGNGRCRVCHRPVSRIEIGDDRNKDCDGKKWPRTAR